MRSSDTSTNHNRPNLYIDWPIIIGKWPVVVVCAYNAQDANSRLDALIGGLIGPRTLKCVLPTLISCHHARIVGQKRG